VKFSIFTGVIFSKRNIEVMVMSVSTEFIPKNPDYEQVVRASFQRQYVMPFLGAELMAVRPGYCEIHLPYRREFSQQHGFYHAGIITVITDSSGGYAALTLMPAGANVVAVEFKMNLLSPADGELLIARAQVIRPGKTLTICQSNAYSVKNGVEKHCAMMQMTLMQVDYAEQI
jgi:uncharacterized protein (TIGR00369 family)